MANPRINRDLAENDTYRYKKSLKILLILQKEKDYSNDFYTSKDEETEKSMKFKNYKQYHEFMLSKITFSMVETFKRNLRKDMSRSFTRGSTILEDLNLSSPNQTRQ